MYISYDKTIFKKIVSVFICLIFIIEVVCLNIPVSFNNVTVSAATLDVSNLWADKRDSLGWCDENNVPTSKMWHYEKQNTYTIGESGSINDETSTISFSGVTDGVPNALNNTVFLNEIDYDVEYDDIYSGNYRKYYVSNADQLIVLLYYYQNGISSIRESSSVNKVCIVLENDLNLGGSEGNSWYGYRNANVFLEIDGQGHTIYDGYFQDSNYGYFLTSDQQLAIHDVTFSNMFIPHHGGMFGTSVQRAYFNNVNFTHCMAIGTTTGVSIVLGYSYTRCYFKDCTISNSYIRGNAHCALFASYNGGNTYNANNSYIGDTSQGISNYYYTDVPSLEDFERVLKGKTVIVDGIGYQLSGSITYPSIYEDCAAIDSEVYECGANHSGTFVSCIQSNIIFKRCFTNCTIYAKTQAGVFVGCNIGSGDGFYYPVNKEKTFVNTYYEDCFSFGSVEGSTNGIGGFIGGIFNDQRAYNPNYSTPATGHRGAVVCNNCYSTSSVGMEYSGDTLGGFVGYIYGNTYRLDNLGDQEHLFINCYAAGEVGGITTDVSISVNNTIGGFIGSYEKTNYLGQDVGLPIMLENCYYDKQTTAMRERDIGGNGLVGSLDGLTGVYTQSSSQKEVQGLTDTVNMQSNHWQYMQGYYPQIASITIQPNISDYNMNSLVDKMKYERKLTYYRYSLASTSTVFLNHYDNYMDTECNEVICTNPTVYDTVRDITSIFSFTSAGNSYSPSGIGTAWSTNIDKNNSSNFTNTFGLQYNATGDSNYKDTYDLSEYGLTGTVENIRNLNVLTIVPSTVDENGETIENSNECYIYKCTDFSPGKQWVTVSIVDGDTYNEWNTQKKAYDEYVLALKKYEILLNSYGTILELPIIEGESLSSYKERILIEKNATTDEDKITAMEQLDDLIEPELVTDPGNIPPLTDSIIGKRNLRLLPTAYIDAGSDMKIKINRNNETETITNRFEIVNIGNGNSETFDKFYHNLTTAYAITSNTNLGNNTYEAQTVGKKDTYNGEFAETNMFPKGNIANGNTSINQPIDMKLIGNSVSNGEGTIDGKTIVKVYKADINSNDNILTKGKEVGEIKDGAYQEWQTGKFEGELNSEGYYYMVYYWRMNDGRYLSDIKLVQISKDSYTVSMTSGILDDSKELSSEPINDDNSAIIDINVKANDLSSEDNIEFPSDNKGYNPADYSTDDRYDGNYIKYDNQNYLAKTIEITTGSDVVTVAWRRNTDYMLTTLIIEVQDDNGEWHEMGSIIYNKDGSYSFDEAEYSYNFETTEYIYNSETHEYSIVTTKNAMKKFNVSNLDKSNGIGNKLVFNFNSSSNGVNDTVKKNIRCTAYFRKVSSSVSADKYVLIDDDVIDIGNPDYENIYQEDGVIVAEEYREVNNQNLEDNSAIELENQKTVLPGDTLIYRTQLKNDGYYNSSQTNLYETLPDGVHLVKDSIRIYRQRKNISASVIYGGIEIYANNQTFTETKYISIEDVLYKVDTEYTITETIQSDGTVVGKYDISSITVIEDGNLIYNQSNLTNNIINSNDFQTYNKYENTEGILYQYQCYTDAIDNKVHINWLLNTLSMEYDYYLEYKVIVDDIGVENINGKEFTSTTTYDSVFMNGNTINSEDAGYLNSNYANVSLVKINEIDTIKTAELGERTYSVQFSLSDKYEKSDDTRLEDIYFENKLDDDFILTKAEIFINKNGSETYLCSLDTTNATVTTKDEITIELSNSIEGKGGTLTITGLSLENDEYYIVKITGTQGKTLTDSKQKITSQFSVVYDEVIYSVPTTYVDNNTIQYYEKNMDSYILVDKSIINQNNYQNYYIRETITKENSLTKTEKITNEVQSQANWIYLNLRKEIAQQDDDQTFIFKVERFENQEDIIPTDLFYVNIRCTDNTYYGEQSIILGKRGYYKVTEITNWSSTDYNTIPTKKYTSNLSSTGNVEYVVYTQSNSSNDSIAFNLPTGLYKSTAIPLLAVSIRQTIDDNITLVPSYPTVTFANELNQKVWKTAQSYAENRLSINAITNAK